MPNSPNLHCPSCHYKAYTECIPPMDLYCSTGVCLTCKIIHDYNTEFCGDPEEIKRCKKCKTNNYIPFNWKKRPCPKCGEKMVVLDDLFLEDIDAQ